MHSEGGYVIQSQNFSVNDGEGIRTTIFFAGCFLRCKWCSNPEGFNVENKVGYIKKNCIFCGKCTKVCPKGISVNLNTEINRSLCDGCGNCVAVCPTNARKQMIMVQTVDSLVQNIKRQMVFYRYSGGGVTFSGGEPFYQRDFLRLLVEKFYSMNINLAVETSANFNFENCVDILKKINMIFVDIKMMDNKRHFEYTKVGNEIILNNIVKISKLGIPMTIRIPVVHGVNDSENNIRETGKFILENKIRAKVELLPYHELGLYKYEFLGIAHLIHKFETPSKENISHLKSILQNMGIEIADYR